MLYQHVFALIKNPWDRRLCSGAFYGMLGLLLVHDSAPLVVRIGNLCAVCHLAPPKGFAAMMLYWCNLLEGHWGALHADLELSAWS